MALTQDQSSVFKEPRIGIGTREIYAGVMSIGAVLYAIYAIMFFYLKLPVIALILASCTLTNIVLLNIKKTPFALLVVIEHTQLFVLVYYAVTCFGWQYGFQLLLILGIALNFFAPFRKRILVFIAPTFETFFYIYLMFMYSDKEPVLVLSSNWVKLIHTGMVIATSILILYATQRADFFSLLNSKKMANVTKELFNLANIDELTGLLNRRAMQEIIYAQWEGYLLQKKNFYLVMCDIDNFKTLNDTKGHAAGDHVLTNVANIFKLELRSSDYICRWGGDEFLLLLINIDSPTRAEELVERVRHAVEKNVFKINEQTTTSITMTFGIASSSNKNSVEEVITSADQQLYRGKELGRNMVCIENPDSTPKK